MCYRSELHAQGRHVAAAGAVVAADQLLGVGDPFDLRVRVVVGVEQVHSIQAHAQELVDPVGDVGVQRVVVVGDQEVAAVYLGVVLRAPGVGDARAPVVVLEERADVDLVLRVVRQRIAVVGLGVGVGVVGQQAEAGAEGLLERRREALDAGVAGVVRARDVVDRIAALVLVEVRFLLGGDQDVVGNVLVERLF